MLQTTKIPSDAFSNYTRENKIRIKKEQQNQQNAKKSKEWNRELSQKYIKMAYVFILYRRIRAVSVIDSLFATNQQHYINLLRCCAFSVAVFFIVSALFEGSVLMFHTNSAYSCIWNRFAFFLRKKSGIKQELHFFAQFALANWKP